MWRKRSCFLLISASLTFLFSGCTIKEDRTLCPAVLRLGLPSASDSLSVLYVTLDSPSGEETTYTCALDSLPVQVSYPVTRERFPLCVSTESFAGGNFKIREGEQCPELFVYKASARVGGEAAFLSPSLQKEFCRIEVRLESGQRNLSLCLRGNYCGMDKSGKLLQGRYRTAFTIGLPVRVPRQGDTSLLLDVEDMDEGVLRSFAIGEYLAKAGYDWNSPSLEDVAVTLNFAESRVSVKTKLWEHHFTISITL